MTSPRAGPWPVLDREVARCPGEARALARWAERSLGPLPTLHERMTADEALAASERLSSETLYAPARELVHAVVACALEGRVPPPVRVQVRANLRVVFPHEPRHVVALHKDSGAGHCPTGRQLWIPLTDVDGSAALHIAPAGVDDEAHAHPVALSVGDVLLFTPDHLHGGVVNETAHTRVSVDVRVAPPDRMRFLRRPLSPRLSPLRAGGSV